MKKMLLLLASLVFSATFSVAVSAEIICWGDVCIDVGDVGVHP
ncbi:hypothetical protein [Erwinia pyrifoliae]|nr:MULTISPECIES: hypothetical protein [Erwinia]MCT2387069.1 hypothetical protein [Erwinia pyrifoliae]